MKKLNILCVIFCVVFVSCSKEELEQPIQEQIQLSILEENHTEFVEDLWEAVNAYRVSKGFASLYLESSLPTALAIEHSMKMRSQGRIGHEGFSKRVQALKEAGAESVGENVAYGYTRAEDIVLAWSNSPTHKMVLEGNYTHCGIGVVVDEGGKRYVTQLFFR